MLPIRINPKYRLLMCYDIRMESYDDYYQYVINEFVPALQSMGLIMAGVWHTAYGDYPVRQVDFLVENLDTVYEIFASDRWEALEVRLKSYTSRYQRKLVRYQDRFQF